MFVMDLLVRMPNFIKIRQCEQKNYSIKFAGGGGKVKGGKRAPDFLILCKFFQNNNRAFQKMTKSSSKNGIK